MHSDRCLRALVMLVLAAGGPLHAAPVLQSPVFGDFSQRVEQYLKLRKALPNERTTKSRAQIVDRRRALAEGIRQARAGAKQGDVFTAEISEQFLRVIRGTLAGTSASSVRRTIRQGEPVAGVQLTVNGAYPEHLPMTTVPPTMLLRLPQLPEKIAYRIVGHNFVLQDTEARLVIDFIPGALP